MTPLSPKPTVAQAVAALNAGQKDKAEQIAKSVLKHHKRSSAAMQVLCEVACLRNNFDEAEKLARRAARIQPRDPMGPYYLAHVYTHQFRVDDAIKQYDTALRLDSKNKQVVAGKARLLELVGRKDEAAVALQPFLDESSEDAAMAVVAVRLAISSQSLDEAVEIARRHLDNQDIEPIFRKDLFYELGRAFERSGQFDDAFDAYSNGNETNRRRFDVRAHEKYVDDLIQTCSAEKLRALPRCASESDLPILIVGMPRSGTSLIEQIIATHSEAGGAGELVDVQRIARALMVTLDSYVTYPACMWDLNQAQATRLGETYIEKLESLRPGHRRVTDKNPTNFEHLGLMSLLTPGARIIHCVRDARDTCLSCFAQPLEGHGHHWSCDLAALGRYYNEYSRLMNHYREALPIPVLDVQYEALIDEPETQMRRIIEFCGLDWDERCLKFYETPQSALFTLSYDQVRRPLYRSSTDRWRKFESHLQPLLETLGDAETA